MCLLLAVGTLLSPNSQQGPYPKMVRTTILKFSLVLSQILKELNLDDIGKPLLKIAFIQFCLGVMPPAYF